MDEKITEIELSKLVKSPYNVRVEASAIGELKKNIEETGLDHPICVRPMPKGKYEVVKGSRRWKAYEAMGKKKIPAIIKEMDDSEAMVGSLSENIMRFDLSGDEKARAVAILNGEKELLNEKDRKLIPSKPLTEQQLADMLGMTRQNVNILKEPLRQAKETRQLVADERITEDTARNIRQFVGDDSKKEVKLAKAIADAELGQTKAREVIQKARQSKTDADTLISKLKGEDLIKDSDIKSKDHTETSTSSGSKKGSLVSGINIDIDVPSKKSSITATITDSKVVDALTKYAGDEEISVDDIVTDAVKAYLKTKGYKV